MMRKPSKLAIISCLFVGFLTNSCSYRQQAVQKKTDAPVQQVQQFPTRAGLLNDYAKVIDENTKAQIENQLIEFRNKHNVEFVVVTVGTTNGQTIYDYSLALAREWKVGTSGPNSGGILLMLATNDREWRVQTTNGLAKDLPDDSLKEIGDNAVEFFTRGQYASGIDYFINATALIFKSSRKTNS
jgi:uncharacterized protein